MLTLYNIDYSEIMSRFDYLPTGLCNHRDSFSGKLSLLIQFPIPFS